MAIEDADVRRLRRIILQELAGIFQGSNDSIIIAEIRTRLRELEADEVAAKDKPGDDSP